MELVKNTGLYIHIDYLSFTFPMDVDDIDNLESAFENYKYYISDIFHMNATAYGDLFEYGQDGYSHQISLGEHIRIRLGGKTTSMKKTFRKAGENGEDLRSDERYTSCMVELKGQACREIEFISGGTVDYIEIFKFFLYDLKGRCTRLDIACDDESGDIIKLPDILKLVENGHYTSCFRTNINPPKLNMSIARDSDYTLYDTNGCSIYFGKSNGKHKSDKELCIYDKKAERMFHKDDVGLSYYCRYEMRFRNETADDVAFYMVETKLQDLGKFARGQLFKMLQLKHQYIDGVKSKNDKVNLWDVLPAWELFLNTLSGVNFSLKPRMEPLIEIKKEWNAKNITKQEIIFELSDYDFDDSHTNPVEQFPDPIFSASIEKLENRVKWFDEHTFTQKDLEMINNYRIRNYGRYISPLTMDNILEYIETLKDRIKLLKDYAMPW